MMALPSVKAKRWTAGDTARALFLATLIVSSLAMLWSCGGAMATLVDGRAYEQVSPEFKAGYAVTGTGAVALDGESVRFNSIGAFSGSGESFALNPYLSRRTGSGWLTSGLFPPPVEGACWKGLEEFSPDLSRFEYLVPPGSTAVQCQDSPTATVWVREPDGSLAQVSPTLTTASGEETGLAVAGGSRDLSRVIIANDDYPGVHLVPTDCGQSPADEKVVGEELIETEACQMRLVGVDNQGKQISLYCATELGGPSSGFGAVSEPLASEIFFSVAINSRTPVAPPCHDKVANPVQIFMRSNGNRTLDISSPLPANCGGACELAAKETPKDAIFQGASEDGSEVFFTSAQPLVSEDVDAGNDLYMATIGCAGATGEACGAEPREVMSLSRISRDQNPGEAAGVQDAVTALSPDGSHVYFVATGDLLTVQAREKLLQESAPVPIPGAENLYAFDVRTNEASFIADLCSGPELSGAVSDAGCSAGLGTGTAPGVGNDSGLWALQRSRDHEAQTTGDGRFLVFSSSGQLVTKGPERDADGARDVYRYDTSTGSLKRVSLGEAGSGANGNDSFDANISPMFSRGRLQEQYELEDRAISEDGETIVFGSAGPLSAAAKNGQRNIYSWQEGRVALISSGTAPDGDSLLGVTPSGHDIFFLTSAGLSPGDQDGLADIYDARVDGGFPLPPAQVEQCAADACYGPLSAPAPALIPGSMALPFAGHQAGSRKSSRIKHRQVKKPKRKKRAKSRSKKRNVSRPKAIGTTSGKGKR
jgi:hypothetical protein